MGRCLRATFPSAHTIRHWSKEQYSRTTNRISINLPKLCSLIDNNFAALHKNIHLPEPPPPSPHVVSMYRIPGHSPTAYIMFAVLLQLKSCLQHFVICVLEKDTFFNVFCDHLPINRFRKACDTWWIVSVK